MALEWKDIVTTKQEARTKLIAPYLAESIVGGRKTVYESITNIDDVDELVNSMSTGKLTAQDVISAYIRK